MELSQCPLKALWLDCFTMRVSELIAGITPQQAWAYADIICEEAGDLVPDAAAQESVVTIPPASIGAF